MNILSPMATGNGAYIIHSILDNEIPDYHLSGYNPYWTLFPPVLPFLGRGRHGIPDLIHTTPDYAAFFNKGKVPLIITFHNFVLDREALRHATLLQRIHYQTSLKLFTRKALSVATLATAVSHFTADLVKAEFGYPGDIKVIYNGLDANAFLPKPKKKARLIKVLFSGNLIRRKGVDLLPYIADNLNSNIEIHYTTGLRTKKTLSFHSKLKSIGPVAYVDMPKAYQDADILLFPTLREGFGLSVVEAMSCGLPVVASDCSSIPELIDEGKGGFLCPVGDVHAFAEKINLLADSPVLRKEMGAYNRAKVEKMFTVQKMIKKYQELFQKAL